MTANDLPMPTLARPRGLEMLAVRLGEVLVRWGRESAERRLQPTDPRAVAAMLAERDALRAGHDALQTRIR